MNPRIEMLRSLILTCVAALALAGCDTLDDINPFGGSDEVKLQGDRVPVLKLNQQVQADPALASIPVTVPPPTQNRDWPEAGGTPSHIMGNLALPATLNQIWKSSIGNGSSSGVKLLSQPIVVGDTIYALDTAARVSALNASNGDSRWRVTISPEDAREETLGGGLGSGDGRIYATAGFPEVMAIEPATGKILWRHKTNAPTRGAPTFAAGRVFVLTIENELLCLNPATGEETWTHSGLPQSEAYLSDAGIAANNQIVVVPYSSGELFALRVESGRVAWSDNLSAVRRASALWSLTDFNGLPVIDEAHSYAVSVSGRMVAIDNRTGARVWQQEIGSSSTPYVAGSYLFAVDSDNQLLAIDTQKGGIRWTSQLARYANAEKRRDPIYWTGAIMAGGRLLIGSSAGSLVEISPQTGKIVHTIDLPDPVFVHPVVANGTLYILTDAGDLIAYR